ncbi:hypothetical protein [Paenibacillus sediminis]
MSRLYNYFLSYWKYNTADTETKRTTLQNAVTKGYITQTEADEIMAS